MICWCQDGEHSSKHVQPIAHQKKPKSQAPIYLPCEIMLCIKSSIYLTGQVNLKFQNTMTKTP
jgi:hypothetical protein